ncbi:hypothetical protein RIR_jg19979.t1 [Rhizophagus irregularis DAOM 181602=DAOM 197198]|nr:hypothetical protein RIR_jg19979.t1 [Rhizophagus irregularis DAOM 181602=DAOM 197198]
MGEPVIYIDFQKVQDLDRDLAFQKLYYKLEEYYQTAEKMQTACKRARYVFTLAIIKNWLNKQALYQIHKPRPKYISQVSFNNITVPMEVIQADLCYMPYNRIGNKTYKFALNCVDIATCTKWIYPLTRRDSASVAKGFVKLFNSRICLIIWSKVKVLMVDGGVEFQDNVIILINKHELDNSVTRLLGISPAEARKKEHVFAKASKSREGPIGFDEPRLSHDVLVRYLLNPGELEDGRRCATDCNWSFQIYHIRESLVQKNQPVLYWLIDDEDNGPKRSFVREKLKIVKDVQLPFRWVFAN